MSSFAAGPGTYLYNTETGQRRVIIGWTEAGVGYSSDTFLPIVADGTAARVMDYETPWFVFSSAMLKWEWE